MKPGVDISTATTLLLHFELHNQNPRQPPTLLGVNNPFLHIAVIPCFLHGVVVISHVGKIPVAQLEPHVSTVRVLGVCSGVI